MRIFLQPSTDWPPSITELVRKRLEFALGRFADRIRALNVRLTDLNGPRGGRDKQCVISVRLDHPRKIIVIEDVHPEAEGAISRAAERAGRAVTRAVQSAGASRTTRARTRT